MGTEGFEPIRKRGLRPPCLPIASRPRNAKVGEKVGAEGGTRTRNNTGLSGAPLPDWATSACGSEMLYVTSRNEGARGEIRTLTVQVLRPAPPANWATRARLCVRNGVYGELVPREGLEPSTARPSSVRLCHWATSAFADCSYAVLVAESGDSETRARAPGIGNLLSGVSPVRMKLLFCVRGERSCKTKGPPLECVREAAPESFAMCLLRQGTRASRLGSRRFRRKRRVTAARMVAAPVAAKLSAVILFMVMPVTTKE